MREMLSNLQKIDRRWIYLTLAIACAVPFVWPVKLSVMPSRETKGVYDTIQHFSDTCARDSEGRTKKVVLMDSTWDAGSLGENQGQAEAVIDHMFREKIPFILVSLGNDKAPQYINKAVIKKFTQDEYKDGKLIRKAKYGDRVYGKDWINLGYTLGGWQVMQLVAKDIQAVFRKDIDGNDTSDFTKLPIMQKVENREGKSSIDGVGILYAVTYSPDENWIAFVHGMYGTPTIFGCAGIESSTKYRFVTSQQLSGLLVSVRGGAEYDVLLNKKPKDRVNKSTELIAPLAFGHLVIIAAIIIGNVGYFAGRRRRS